MTTVKRVAAYKRIFQVLVENENGYLSPEEITERAFGPFYHPKAESEMVKLIKRNIAHAASEAERNGMMIIPIREACKPRYFTNDFGEREIIETKISRFRILGYKIADKSDLHDIEDVLEHKEERVKSAIEQSNKLLDEVKHQGLLPETHKMLNN